MSAYTVRELLDFLRSIDGRGYKSYKELKGSYDFSPNFFMYIDYVQGDPFAAPSKLRVRVPHSVSKIPAELFSNRIRNVALSDYITRIVSSNIYRMNTRGKGSGKSGMISVDVGNQCILERTAVKVTREWIEARIEVGLPAAGRSVLGRAAADLLTGDIPYLTENSLFWNELSKSDQEKGIRFVECAENQHHIRKQLKDMNMISFVANGSILPRESGNSDRPMKSRVIPFQSPKSLEIEVELKNEITWNGQKCRKLSGLGIPKGITLIVGGGYHGKSTLLNAVELGVYSHIPGDGREYCITIPDAVKIRAEDGRRVEKVNISGFINNLPYGRSTVQFDSEDASGSTSQAANIIEAVELGAVALLLDEDTCATNFMVRDSRMQALVSKEHEPITPFIDRIKELYDNFDVSTIIVMGGSGDYFDVADNVIMMKEYIPYDVTGEAKDIATSQKSTRKLEAAEPVTISHRVPLAESFDASRGRRDVKIDAKGLQTIVYGTETIDLRYLEQLVDFSQTRAIGKAIYLTTVSLMNGKKGLKEVLEDLDEMLDKAGLDQLDTMSASEEHPGNFARPRKYEIAGAINRLRTVRMKQQGKAGSSSSGKGKQ